MSPSTVFKTQIKAVTKKVCAFAFTTKLNETHWKVCEGLGHFVQSLDPDILLIISIFVPRRQQREKTALLVTREGGDSGVAGSLSAEKRRF